MKKDKLILIVGGSISAVLVLVAAVLAGTAFGKASAAKKKLNSDFRRVQKFYTNDPFPSAENLATAESNLEVGKEWVDKLTTTLSKGQIKPAPRQTPGDFTRQREEVIERLIKTAPKNANNEPVVKSDFLFGFDRFASGVPATKRDVPRLLTQLECIDKLVNLLYESGIQTLDGVGREEFDSGDTRSAEDDEGIRRRRGRQNSRAATAGPMVVPVEPFEGGAIELGRNRFGLRFTTREAGLVAFLNAVDAMRPYAMIHSLELRKVGDDVVFPDEAAKKETASSGRTRRSSAQAEEKPVEAATVVNAKPAPRSSRVVSGPLREKPVMVTMLIDIYSVPASEEGSEAAQGEEE